MVAFLIWVYYSAQIFFLGAEFTRAFSERHGSRAGLPALRREEPAGGSIAVTAESGVKARIVPRDTVPSAETV
jgi:membrane protein